MKTIEGPTPTGLTDPPGGRRPPEWGGLLTALAILGSIPLLLVAVLTRWGVLLAVVLAIVAGIFIWIWHRGFAFIQVAGFLIHFDGVGVGPIRMGRIIAAIAVLVILYKLVAERWRPPAVPARHWVPVWIFAVWAILSGLWSQGAGSWLFGMGMLGLGLTFFGITALLIDSHDKIQQFLKAYWMGGLWGSGAGILALFLGTRSVGFGADPNFFGLLQATMIPLSVYYRRHAPTPRAKLQYTFALLFVLAGTAGAGSRSGLIGAVIAIVGTMVTRPGLSAGRRSFVAFSSLFVGGIAFLIGMLHPANAQRGFSDRGAGRLDLWTTSIDAIREQPLIGYGMGQLRSLVVPKLLVTPGSQLLSETREEVSAHNTWLDIAGDLGTIGLVIFVTIIVITMVGFLRPRWLEARELSTLLFVMMLPVLSGSVFLPLMNNKVAWMLVGLAAALQVPSWGARWSGLPATPGRELVRAGSGRPRTAVVALDAPTQLQRWSPFGSERWEAVRLARWDLRVSRRTRMFVVLGAVLGSIVLGVGAQMMPTKYTATAGLFIPRMDSPEGTKYLEVNRSRLQGVLTTAVSGAYAVELKRLAGLDLPVSEVRDRLYVDRPRMGIYVRIRYSDTSEANTLAVQPHLVGALDAVYDSIVEFAEEQTANELRQMVPGERVYYTGRHYLRAYSEATLDEEPPRTVWSLFIGALSGGAVALGVAFLQQRRPRVNNDDDVELHTGLSVWAHVGRQGRRYGATAEQYAQVVTAARERVAESDEPRRFVVASARPDRAVRGLAMGIASSLVSEGRRVLLVDAQLDRPALSLRLGGLRRPGLLDLGEGKIGLEHAMRRVARWRLPTAARNALGRGGGELRFVSAGRSRTPDPVVPLEPFDQLDPEVHVVLLAPSVFGDVANAGVFGWGDAVVLGLVEGRTVTFDAEDAASRVRSFAAGPAGVVLLDV